MFWRPMWPIFSSFRGSCCVKMAKIHWKSPFLAHFKLSMTGNFFLCNFLYVKCLIDQLFNLSMCFGGLYDQFSLFSGGSCCVKMAKNDSKSRFLPPFDLLLKIVSCVILYIKCLIDQLYNLSIGIGSLCDQFLFTFSGGHVV